MAGTARTAKPGGAGGTARGARLNRDDWLRAALDIMVDEGISGVRIPRLCERLGVTKGSFYWHFQDLDAFLGALAERWAAEGMRVPGTLQAADDPAATLLEGMRLLADRRSRNLIRAVRDWARHDERARAALRKADRALFEGVRDALAGMGFDEQEAELRAKVLFYAGIGFAHVGTLGSRRSAQEQLAATWDLVTRR